MPAIKSKDDIGCAIDWKLFLKRRNISPCERGVELSRRRGVYHMPDLCITRLLERVRS
jgi:hypothetical protein